MSLYKSSKVNTKDEKKILTAMIVNTEFLKSIMGILNMEYFEIPFARVVAGWCVDYYRRFEEAPGLKIQDIFRTKMRREEVDEAKAELIESFLYDLSSSFEEGEEEVNSFGHPFFIEQAQNHFRKKKLEMHKDEIDDLITENKIEEAETIAGSFSRIAVPKSMGVEPHSDPAIIRKAFAGAPTSEDEDVGDYLFTLKGDLGRMLGPFFRKQFFAVLGPVKRGKSQWLQEIGDQAYGRGLNVAYISLEMSAGEITERLSKKTAGASPEESRIYIPTFDCWKNQTGSCNRTERTCRISLFDPDEKDAINLMEEYLDSPKKVLKKYEPCTVCIANRKHGGEYMRHAKKFIPSVWFEKQTRRKLTWQEAYRKLQSAKKMARGARYKIIEEVTDNFSITDLQNLLDNWEHYEGFIPDVLLIDYADLMVPHKKISEYRHQIDSIWKGLRGTAQKRFCFLGTASQTSKATFDGGDVTQKTVSEDSRKIAHTSISIGLNQTEMEKMIGRMNIIALVHRHRKFNAKIPTIVLENLSIGKPYLNSYWTGWGKLMI